MLPFEQVGTRVGVEVGVGTADNEVIDDELPRELAVATVFEVTVAGVAALELVAANGEDGCA